MYTGGRADSPPWGGGGVSTHRDAAGEGRAGGGKRAIIKLSGINFEHFFSKYNIKLKRWVSKFVLP